MKSPVTAIGVFMLLGGNIVRAAPRNILEREQIQHLDDAAIRGLVENRPEMKGDPGFLHPVVPRKSLELPPPLEPVVPNKTDASDDGVGTDPIVQPSTKAPSPTSNGGERLEAIASDHAPGTPEEHACEGDDATPNGTASNTPAENTTADVPAKAPGDEDEDPCEEDIASGGATSSYTSAKDTTVDAAEVPGEEDEDPCEEDVASGGATSSYTSAKDTTVDAAKVPGEEDEDPCEEDIASGGATSSYTSAKDTTANVPAKAPGTNTGVGASGPSEEEDATPSSATGYTPAKDTMHAPSKPLNSGTYGTINPAKDTTSADAPAKAPNAGSGASRDIPTKGTIFTDASGQASESRCQCVCDDMSVNGSSSETKTRVPNGQEPAWK